jgi:tRNA threonylcarbamoyladenosine biosynthesis protein TsaE
MSDTSFSLALKDADHTRATGASIGHALLKLRIEQPLTIHLNGDLGAGKTTLVGGMLNAMGFVGAVRSPTYTLIEPYEFARDIAHPDPLQVMHMDLYRLTDASQLEELGVRDMLVPNTVLLIEWPDRAEDRLPAPDVEVNLAYPVAGISGRALQLIAHSSQAKQLLNGVQWQ